MTASLIVDQTIQAAPPMASQGLYHALEQLGFNITRATPGRIEARLGSRIRAGLRLADRGVQLDAAVTGVPSESRILLDIRISDSDAFDTPLSVLTDQILTAVTVQQSIDEDLSGLAADPSTSTPVLVVPAMRGSLYTAALTQPELHYAVRGQLKVMEVPDLPLHGIAVIDSKIGAAQVPRQRLRELLDLAEYVGGSPSALPESEQEALVDLIGALWMFDRGIIQSVRLGTRVARVANVIDLQHRLRLALPTRLVMICRECAFERVVNPEYARLARRNKRIRTAITTGSAAMFPHATAMTIGSRLIGGVGFEPDYVCQRCQGLAAVEHRATICPRCGQLRKEVILGTCPKAECGHDLTSTLGRPYPLFMKARQVAAPSGMAAARGANPRPTAGAWSRDPTGAARYRWHDGQQWTAWVCD